MSQPLTDLTGKGAFKWTGEHDLASQEMKAPMAKAVFCAGPDSDEPFLKCALMCLRLSTWSCCHATGETTSPLFKETFSNSTKSSTHDKELLAITATSNAFHSALLGTDITICTDHKNLTCDTIHNRCVLNWCLALEDFEAKHMCLPGKDDVLTGTFSCLPQMDSLVLDIEGKTAAVEDASFVDPELVDCFVNLQEDQTLQNPVDLEWIQTH